jgi:hypothetical protein
MLGSCILSSYVIFTHFLECLFHHVLDHNSRPYVIFCNLSRTALGLEL